MSEPMVPAEAATLVVDDDEISRNLIVNALLGIEHSDTLACSDGAAAWDEVQGDHAFGLIIMDWRLPKMSGLALINRIRSLERYRKTPILVVSGFLHKHDFRLLQEYPCTALLEKPFTNALLQARVKELHNEATWYGQNEALMDSLLEAVKGNGRAAEQLLKQVLKKAPQPLPLALLAAKRLVRANMLKSALAVLESVLKIDAESVIALNELGKVLHMLGRHQEALQLLQRATNLSPQSVERLCLTGEVELNLSDPESARACFLKALQVDHSDQKALNGLTVADNYTELLEAPSPLQVPKSFASLLNTIGIGFVRSGDFARGLEQYQAALSFLHRQDDRARVSFNLGLGYLRWGKPAEALPWFQRSEAELPQASRSSAYVAKLVQADPRQLREQEFEASIEVMSRPASSVSSEGSEAVVLPFPSVGASQEPAGEADDGLAEEGVIDHERSAVKNPPVGEVAPTPDEGFDDIAQKPGKQASR